VIDMHPTPRRSETAPAIPTPLVAIACLMLAMLSGRAPAGDAGIMNLDGSQPRVIPASAFQADGLNRNYYYTFAGGYMHPLGGTVCMIAPVYLPSGYIVNGFGGLLYDNAVENFGLVLQRKNLYDTSSRDIMASVSTEGASTAVRQLTTSQVSDPVIDNFNFAYSVVTCMADVETNHRLYAATILAYPSLEIFSNGFE